MNESTASSLAAPPDNAAPTLHRSGAVAQMLRMPVATLRVWERRYGLTRPALSASGQRLYSADDVRRLALIKQLTDLGHAIGRLARLDMPQLQGVASTHAHVLAAAPIGARSAATRPSPDRRWRLVVIGTGLGERLRRPALLGRLGRPLEVLGPYETSARAAIALGDVNPDAVLFHEPQLHAGWRSSIEASAPALASLPKAVLYGFAADAVCDELASAGISLLREPQPDAVLAQWLASLSAATHPAPPARWDEAALADFAGLSTTLACECPRHVAELLVQLSRFEAYSAECEHRSAADAAVHAYLRRVAAEGRAGFEAALEHVARHEGLLLPPPRRHDGAPAASVRARRPE